MNAAKSEDNGLILHVRVTPKGGGDAVLGFRAGDDGRSRLAVRVAAPPRDGEANEAVRRLIAKAADLSRGAVSIVGGERAREKIVKLKGDPQRLKAWLDGIETGT